MYAVSINWVKLLRDSQLLTCQLVHDLAVERLHTFCVRVAYIIVDFDSVVFVFQDQGMVAFVLQVFFKHSVMVNTSNDMQLCL